MYHTSFVFPFNVKRCCGANVGTSDLTNGHQHGMHFAFSSMQHAGQTSLLIPVYDALSNYAIIVSVCSLEVDLSESRLFA